MNDRPRASEYPEYFGHYVERVPDGDVVRTLEDQMVVTQRMLRAVPLSREGSRYAPDKWSIREAVAHLVDIERVFGIRALHAARQDRSPLPFLKQDDWAVASGADGRALADLLDEWQAVRRSHVITCLEKFGSFFWIAVAQGALEAM